MKILAAGMMMMVLDFSVLLLAAGVVLGEAGRYMREDMG